MEGQIFIFWNWSVAVYLFIAGVSAGALGISSLAYLSEKSPMRELLESEPILLLFQC